MELTQEELERYRRNILLAGIGEAGQIKLKQARVFVAGAGGLGSPILYYLAAAGVGNIGICDGDTLETSNLQRQILHNTHDLNKNKANSAQEKLQALNPNLHLEIFPERLTPQNILTYIKNYDIIVEATDVFSAKFLINDACILANKILIRGSALAFGGQAMSIKPRVSACYACLFNEPPKTAMPTSASVGILGAVAGLFGCIEANEVLKIITGIGTPLFDKLLTCDVRQMDFRTISIKRNHSCRVCGDNGIKNLDASLYR